MWPLLILALISLSQVTASSANKVSTLFKTRGIRTLADEETPSTSTAESENTNNNNSSSNWWDWWYVFQDSNYFIPVVVCAGVLILGCGLGACIWYRRRHPPEVLLGEINLNNTNTKCGCGKSIGPSKCGCGNKGLEKCGCNGAKGLEKCGCNGAKGLEKCGCNGSKGLEKCGCQGAKGLEKCGCNGAKGMDKCGCQGAKCYAAPMKPIKPLELYATRSLTASTAIDASIPLSDPQAAIQAIV